MQGYQNKIKAISNELLFIENIPEILLIDEVHLVYCLMKISLRCSWLTSPFVLLINEKMPHMLLIDKSQFGLLCNEKIFLMLLIDRSSFGLLFNEKIPQMVLTDRSPFGLFLPAGWHEPNRREESSTQGQGHRFQEAHVDHAG